MAKSQEADPTRPKINSLGGPRVICIDLFMARWIAYCYKPAEVAA